ncbi:MAG: hypothetical protein UT80_C0027G0006 [Parcubacteria group bacterium GW2011_GWC1_40_13]|nr:MAG: hypothetical protein UT80_C0027G0006 [Parcubacteria group bacterium GW2011_GWC1_40_13]
MKLSKDQFVGIIVFTVFAIIGGLIFIGAMSERPIKIERIWGTVESVNGNYRQNKDPLDCHLITKFENGNMTITTSYRVTYDSWGPTDDDEYNKCWKILLLKQGDPISAIKRTWADDDITYELAP